MRGLGDSFGRDSGIQLHRPCIFEISETSAQIIARVSMLIEKCHASFMHESKLCVRLKLFGLYILIWALFERVNKNLTTLLIDFTSH